MTLLSLTEEKGWSLWHYIFYLKIQFTEFSFKFFMKKKYSTGYRQSKLDPFLSLKIQDFILFFNFTMLYGFCHISTWIHHRYTRVPHTEPSSLLPPPSPYHPSGPSQCTSPKHPVSCVEPGLVTRFIFDIIHVSMPFSQIIPPSPSPTESKRLFYRSVSLLLSRRRQEPYTS